MATVTIKESAVGNAVGTNYFAGHREQIRPVYRRVRRLGFVGSSLVGNAAVDLFYGNTYIGTFYNTSSGANLIPVDAKDMINVESSMAMEPLEPLNILVSVVTLTNIGVITVEIEEIAA